MKKVTFKDIANESGYSKATISRYFNDPDSLTDDAKEKILKAINKLGYKENKIARVLANGKSEIIGVLIPDLYMHYYADLLTKLLVCSDKYGYKAIVFQSLDDSIKEKEYLEELLKYHVEGVIVISHVISSKELASMNIPLVTIEREDQYTSSINSNNYEGGLLATRHLVDRGAEVLIHINSGLKKESPAYGRIKGYRQVVKESKLESKEFNANFGDRYEEVVSKFKPIFNEIEDKYKGKKKGIFLSNDTIANVFLNLIVQKYKTLPDDYLLIGFDDSPISKEAIIPLSTIHQDITAIAEKAMHLLNEKMQERKKRHPKKDETIKHEIVDTTLIIRDTTRGKYEELD